MEKLGWNGQIYWKCYLTWRKGISEQPISNKGIEFIQKYSQKKTQRVLM